MEQRKSGKTPDPVDLHVGRRVRARRLSAGLSQTALAQSIGVTFQQVQKYERGANRISVSKLYRIAGVTGAPVSHFFEGLPDPASGTGAASGAAVAMAVTEALLAAPGGRELAAAFVALKPSVRTPLVSLARSMAGEPDLGRLTQG